MGNFNERNTVEHFIIDQLSGVNLNQARPDTLKEAAAQYGTDSIDFGSLQDFRSLTWQYKASATLRRDKHDIWVEAELSAALCRLNPDIGARPELAAEVIRKLRAILLKVNHVGLVRANEEFAKWLRGEVTLPLGQHGAHVPIRLIDFDQLQNNSYWLTNQYQVHAHETKIPDIVMLVNGLPLVVGEAKTPVRPAVSWFDGAHDIHEIYENSIPQLFVPNVFSFATEGKELFLGTIRTPPNLWSPWRVVQKSDFLMSQKSDFLEKSDFFRPPEVATGQKSDVLEKSDFLGLQQVGSQLRHLLHPATLLDILQYFTMYATHNKRKKIKVVSRYQQYQGANALVKRVVEGQIKQGLIWHFQGSGKSLLMLFAAQKLRKLTSLNNPTILIVVDRIDLDTQITATFSSAEVANMVTTNNMDELHDLLAQDSRKIIITMIHKFKEAPPNLNTRANLIVMVDEAHRTQEGNLGRHMRAALPNAFLFGLTGTPINRGDKNTFWAFGSRADASGYLSRYTFQDSLRDKATLPLHFEPRLPNYHLDKDGLDLAFNELANDLSEEDKNKLSQKAAKMAVFLKSPERIRQIVQDILAHFTAHVQPAGFKAMIVAPDRLACIQYKTELDHLLPSVASRVVISSSPDDSLEFKQQWSLDKDQQEQVITEFNDPNSPLHFLIVTAKLLTGFDAPILQTMYLDKSLKDHTLLQAICRTNRLYPQKTFGRIVDYFGVFDDTAQALAFDEETMQQVITQLSGLKSQLAPRLAACLAHFQGVDRTLMGFAGLQAAQDKLKTDSQRDAFAVDFQALAQLWEALSPDEILNSYQADYYWLSQIYVSVKPPSDDDGRLLWYALGAQTTKLIHDHLHVQGINHDLATVVLDATVIDNLRQSNDPQQAQRLLHLLGSRLARHGANPLFVALSTRLDTLRARAEQGLINSLEFIKQLCDLARDTLQAEKLIEPPDQQKLAKAALTELFLEMKTDQTPAVVERIVNDIDNIVKYVRFEGWQNAPSGERTVRKELRKIVWVKYQIKDETLFNRAYAYIREYY